MNYLNGIYEEHTADSSQIKAIFNLTVKGALDKLKAEKATKTLFKAWDVELTSNQEQQFTKLRFEPVWDKFLSIKRADGL